MQSPEYPGCGSVCEKWVVCGFSHMPSVVELSLRGMRGGFLTRGGMPHLRRQAVAKCFGLESPPRSAWRVEDAAVHQGGVALLGPPKGSVRSQLETSDFTAVRRFEFCDGMLPQSVAHQIDFSHGDEGVPASEAFGRSLNGGVLPKCTSSSLWCVVFAASTSSGYGRSVTSTKPIL